MSKENPNNEFSNFVLRTRLLDYYSAKVFWNAHQSTLKMTYEHYQRIEKGGPASIKAALAIIEALQLDEASALNAWVRSQLSNPRHKSYFADQSEPERNKEHRTIISPKQTKELEKDPFLYKVVIYLALFSSSKQLSIKMVAKEFNLTYPEAMECINKLKAIDLIDLRNERLVFSGWYVVPDNQEYRHIRRANFNSHVKMHLDQKFDERWSHERLTIRRVHKKRVDELKQKLHALYRWFVNSDIEETEESGVPYAFFTGAGRIESFKNYKKYYNRNTIRSNT